MRIRIRGPSGSTSINISESATLGDLLAQVAERTSIQHFDVKSGYPPKPLVLDQYDVSATLSDLDLKQLDGEQLIVSAKDDAQPVRGTSNATSVTIPQIEQTAQRTPNTTAAHPSAPIHTSSTTPAPSQFSFAGVGSAPSPTINNNNTNGIPNSKTLSSTSSTSSTKPPPLTLTRAQNKSLAMDAPEIPMPSRASTLVLRVMPDDNSCLFRAFGSAFLGTMDSMNELRSLIAQSIQAESETYSEVVLEQKPDQYCMWIQNEDAWGGGIELSILSKHFDIEICSIDVQSLRVDRYNEGRAKRCIIVYSGIHYDTIALSPSDAPYTHAHAPPEFDEKVFDTADDVILNKALELCKVLQGKHYYTDTAGFGVRCNICGERLVGEKGATAHAERTGHSDFKEAS
ncbi:MAG: ubiquitin-specific protease otu1 [Candelina submexicana]|nr:MAG: ubiquitin-specific protease otu1 [Candelina submexicana]